MIGLRTTRPSLAAQLHGLAKSSGENILEDSVETVAPSEIFVFLEQKFKSPEAIALAQLALADPGGFRGRGRGSDCGHGARQGRPQPYSRLFQIIPGLFL